MTDAPTRFWAKVDRQSDDECWAWTATTNGRGYGLFRFGGRTTRAHRFSYELARGPIPTGLELDHLCRNTLCVNPAHLEAVDHRTNVLRGVGIAAKEVTQTHCLRGHPFNEVNTYVRPTGGRTCRECRRLVAARWRARRRAT